MAGVSGDHVSTAAAATQTILHLWVRPTCRTVQLTRLQDISATSLLPH